MAEAEVVAIGETMALVTPVEPEPLESARAFAVEAGGAESNVALWLAEAGRRTAWVSRLGDDPLGRRVLGGLRRHGVDTRWVELDPAAPTGVYFKDCGPHGTRVHYYRAGSAASRLSPASLERLPLERARIVHVSGITAALSGSCLEMLRCLLERCARPGGPLLSFDVNHRPGLWPAERAAPVLRELAARADLVFAGRDEAQALWGTATAADVRALLPEPAHLVVKDAAVGAHDFHAGRPGGDFVPSRPVRVVEAVGAGDAFAAGYLAALLDGAPPPARLARGHATAARALSGTADFVPSGEQPL